MREWQLLLMSKTKTPKASPDDIARNQRKPGSSSLAFNSISKAQRLGFTKGVIQAYTATTEPLLHAYRACQMKETS